MIIIGEALDPDHATFPDVAGASAHASPSPLIRTDLTHVNSESPILLLLIGLGLGVAWSSCPHFVFEFYVPSTFRVSTTPATF